MDVDPGVVDHNVRLLQTCKTNAGKLTLKFRCSGISLAALTLSGMVNFIHPEFVAKQWQTYLFYVAMALITAVPVFIASKRLSWIVQTALFLSILGMTLTLFVPVGMHKHVNSGSYLVQSGLGTSGWNSGTAWVLGITNCMYAFGGTDGGKALDPRL